MGFFLKLVLAASYIAVGSFIFLYPQQTQDYIEVRYKGIMKDYGNVVKGFNLLQEFSMSTLSLNVFKGIGIFFGFIGLLALLSIRKCFMFCSVLVLIIGEFLHCPCVKIEGIKRASQLHTFMGIFSILCATLAYPKCKPEERKEQKGEKVKTD